MEGAIRPGSARAWLLACRPATLTAAIVPVIVGTAVARASGGVRWAPALAALAGAVLIQITTNLANDVFDFAKGADTHERLGPTRAAQSGLLTPRALRLAMVATIVANLPIGLYLASVGGWPIVALGVVSIASGVAYTGGPWPLGYNGLGDVFVFAFFGVAAVCGTAFVQVGAVPPLALLASVPVGALATAVLVVNNVRDRETDVRAGKRTIAVRFGRRVAVGEYFALLAAAYAAPAVAFVGFGRSPWSLAPLVTLPFAARLARSVATEEGRPLNATLVSTAKLLLVYGVLFSAGLAAGSA